MVLDTLKRLQRDRAITMVLVSHDLGVIRTMPDRVMMRRGRVVEQGLADQICGRSAFSRPRSASGAHLPVHARPSLRPDAGVSPGARLRHVTATRPSG
ncbi:hypothetical protein CN97_14940 [Haematobacter massiliensis]|uniref:Oligopeptide/dipeptide ABC transporter C-terminal domain-containing protein n=1 Tax=Haematobacter massiliensis TaxID=195105 RepID=A0A086Y735_9RHOB|nr:hypothetical protein [Haematobacter massiliensis]KFI30085.1 hypothetical protein CN97_14940 [Haematobacter massiliensis]